MNFNEFKQFAKAGLFLILIISLVGNANAATGHPGGIALSWDDVINIDPCSQNIQLFENYNATCTININSNDLSTSGQSTKNNLNSLHSAGWEVATHGHNHEDSVAFLNNYTSQEWLDQEIFPNIVAITGYGYPYSFAYPYGSRNGATDAVLAPYFRTLRTTEFETMNGGQDVNKSAAYYMWDDTQVLYAVEIDDNSGVSLESIQNGIDYAIENEYVLLLYGHTITSNVTGDYQTSTSKLESILNYTYSKGGKFYHMGELGNSSWVQPPFSNVTANFTVSKDHVTAGENVTFVDYSENQTSELLDFGDGSTKSSTANVNHTYAKPGSYTATLTVKNSFFSHSITKTIIVNTGHTGGIALSWDDVQNVDPCYQNLTMFKKYNATCTMNVNKLSDWGKGTITELNALHSAGWEIAGHGYAHEDAVAFLNKNTSQEWIDQEILPNIAEITGYGYPVYSFAYPYGSQNGTTDALLDPYFRTLRTTNFGTVNVNESAAYYRWDNAQLVYAVEIDDNSGVSLESIQYGIDEAIKYGYVLVLYGHSITSNVTGPYQTSTSRLDSILNYTYQKGGKFYHMEDLGNSSWVRPSFSNVTANFTSNPTAGFAPLNVTFTDTSTGLPTFWLWDFGDGVTPTEQNPMHIFSTAGNYTVKLTVSRGHDVASKTATINVQANIPDDDGGSSGGRSHRSGGGGGGGSPEPARNVEVKELSQTFVTNGKAIKFDFTKNATCVVFVDFDAKKTAGKTTTIVEQLKNKSTLTSNLTEGEVYRYFNVWVGNSGFATSSNIENPVICFKVEKSWLQNKNIDQNSIILNMYSNKKWEQLPVNLLKEDSKYLYFTANVSGYSFFAITGKTNITPEKTGTEIQPDVSDNSEDMENTSLEANQKPEKKENTGMPGFEIVCGVSGLLAVFLYKRR